MISKVSVCLLLSLAVFTMTAEAVAYVSKEFQSNDLISSGMQKLSEIRSKDSSFDINEDASGDPYIDMSEIYGYLNDISHLYEDYNACDALCEDGIDRLVAYQSSIDDWIDIIDDTVADQNMVIINMLTPIESAFQETLDSLDIELGEKESSKDELTAEYNQNKDHFMEISDVLLECDSLIDDILGALVEWVQGENQTTQEEELSMIQVGLGVTRDFFKPKIEALQQRMSTLVSKNEVSLMHDTIKLLQDIDTIDWEEDSDKLITLLTLIDGNLEQIKTFYDALYAQIEENYNTMCDVFDKSVQDIMMDYDNMEANLDLIEGIFVSGS